jgi:hypothetical protein
MSNEDFNLDEFKLDHSNGLNMNYLSPSTINSYIERRGTWYRQKVEGMKFQANPNMARGTAVEHAINCWLATGDSKEMVMQALAKFDLELKDWIKTASKSGMDKHDEIRATIPGLVEVAYRHYDMEFTARKPITQHKISCNLPGVQREILGYLDYFRPQFLVNDSKVVSKTPAGLSQGYIIQGSLYKLATGCDVVFDFFIPNKTPVAKSIKLSDDEFIYGLSYATEAAKVLEELETCEDPKRIMKLMAFPNLSSFWTYEEKAEAAAEYGIKLS